MNPAYVLAELTRRPARTMAGLLSVAVGVALFITLLAYANAYRQAARFPLTEIGANIVAQRQGTVPKAFQGVVLPHSTAPIHRHEIETIQTLPGVQALAEAIFFWDFEHDGFLVGLGLDPSTAVGPGRLRAGLRAGRFLEAGDRGVAVADASYAAQKHLGVGDAVTIAGEPIRLVGIVDTSRAGPVANANLYVSLTDARAFASAAPNVRAVFDVRPDDADILFVRTDPSHAPSVSEQIRQVLGSKAIMTTPRSFEEVLGATFDLIDRFCLLVGLAGVMIAMAGLLRAVAAGLWERRRDIGLMRAVGWRRRDVVTQLAGETLVLTGLGELAGLALAGVVTWGLRFSQVTIPVPWELTPTPHFLPGGAMQAAVTVPLQVRISPNVAVTSLAVGLLGGILVSLWVARRAANIKSAEVWRSE